MGKLKLKSPIIKLIILLFVLIPILFFIYQTDFTDVFKSLKNIGFQFVYIILSTFIAYLLGTLSWYVCLGQYKTSINIFQLFTVRQIGETVGLYNPTSIVGGDYLKAELLKRYDIPDNITIDTVILSRLTAILSQISLFILALIWPLLFPCRMYIVSFTGNYIYLLLSILILGKLALLIWLTRSKKLFIPAKNPLKWHEKNIDKIKKKLNELKQSIQNNSSSFWKSYTYATLHWIVGSLEFYLILLFLGYDLKIMDGLLLDMSVIVIKSFAAIVPGQIGVEEFANKIVLGMIGISGASIWITVSILRRSRQLFWILVGFLLFAFIKKNLKNVSTAY